MGTPSQAHRLAALPDVVEIAAWMLYALVTAHTAPEAAAKARGVALEAVLQGPEFHQLACVRHCDMISSSLAALGTPHCAPDELRGGHAGGQLSARLLAVIFRAGWACIAGCCSCFWPPRRTACAAGIPARTCPCTVLRCLGAAVHQRTRPGKGRPIRTSCLGT